MPPWTPSGVRKGLLVNTQGTPPGDDFFAPARPVAPPEEPTAAADEGPAGRRAPFAHLIPTPPTAPPVPAPETPYTARRTPLAAVPPLAAPAPAPAPPVAAPVASLAPAAPVIPAARQPVAPAAERADDAAYTRSAIEEDS